MPSIEIDIVLNEGEAPDELSAELSERFNVDVIPQGQVYNCHATWTIYGSDRDLARVRQWHNASHKPRPDLVGKPPVAKGEKR